MTTDTKLNQLIINKLTQEQYDEAKAAGTLSDTEFYITDSDDEALTNNNISNCITEIPQDIKLELNNGTLTLKAGSKVYVPNRFEVDGTTPKFDVKIIESDIIVESLYTDGPMFIYYVDNTVVPVPSSWSISGTSNTITDGYYTCWYDTTNNIIKIIAGDEVGSSGMSLPLAIVNGSSNGDWTSIDQVFNGFGYMGSTVFALPGVKGLIPNSRNADGSLKSIEFTTTSVKTTTYSNVVTQTSINIGIAINLDIDTQFLTYNKKENFNYNSKPEKVLEANVATLDIQNGKVTSFTPKTSFHAVDWNDFQQLASNIFSAGNIGDIKYTSRIDVPNGGALCDGALYTKAQFPDVYQMLVDGKLQSTTVTDFDSIVSSKGYCELFALDTSNERFKVPSLPNKFVIDTNTTAPVIGNGMALGFLNGDNTDSILKNRYAGNNQDGAWIVPSALPANIGSLSNTGVGSAKGAVGITTDPAKSGMIADTSSTGKFVTYRAYVVLYTSATEASVSQAAEFMTAIGGKANVTLDNVSPAQSFKKQAVGWSIPDYNSGITLTFNKVITNAGESKTMAKSGLFCFEFLVNNVVSTLYFYVNNNFVGKIGNSQTSLAFWDEINFPVTKGDVVKVKAETDGGFTAVAVESYLFPYKGSMYE